MPPESDHRTPGQLIEELLAARGWTQRVLAIVLGSSETGINKLIAGKQSVDAKMAIALSELFGIEAQRFLELQNSYDLAREKIVTKADPGRATRAYLFGDLPITEMIKRGWLDAEDVRNVPQVETALMKFFGVESLDKIDVLPFAAKKTIVLGAPTPAQVAWLYRAKEIAGELLVPRYSPELAALAVGKLSALRSSVDDIRKVPRILSEGGIRYVAIESLTGSKIDGACFWLNEESPVIAMSIRFDRIDNFWFVLRHECEHVLQLHGQTAMILDSELEGERAGVGPSVPEEERVANEAASEFCVPRKSLEQFVARKDPFYALRDIIGFARTLRVHPGLVAGQLQRRTGRYDRFRDHLAKIRTTLTPNAASDGWGNVYPVGI